MPRLTLLLTLLKILPNPHKLSPKYDPHPPAHTDSSPPSERQFYHSQKIEYLDIFRCRSGYRQHTKYLKTDSEAFFSKSFCTNLEFLSSTNLSQENLLWKWWHWSKTFCCGRNRFLPQLNLSELFRHYLSRFPQLRMVLERNSRYTQNRLKVFWICFKNSVCCLKPGRQWKTSGKIILLCPGGGGEAEGHRWVSQLVG